MLIRVNGGKAGIKEYLEEGIKNGRDYSRDELDERVILDGDLAQAHDIIQSMETDAQRYLHITLSFKEDHIDEATLKAVTDDFKAFAMKAYREEEYAFYAEAHIPKIKTYQDKSTGELVERKPHIHVVIPQTNLVTHQRLKPFDYEKHNAHYIDAFQEVTNEKYSLASPKEHVRSTFTDESTLISRHKGDIFPTANRQTKANALDVLLQQDITTTAQFQKALEDYGFEVKVRNQGKNNEYLNIRAPEQKRGVNLKESVFQPTFVALPKTEKLLQLNHQYNPYSQNGDSQYKASQKHHQDLKYWHDTRAEELRYVNRRNRATYKTLTLEQKQQFLTEKRNEHGQRSVSRASLDDINQSIRAASQHLHHAQRHRGRIESGVRNFHHRRAIRTVIANLEHHSGNQSVIESKRRSSDTLSQIQYHLESRVLPDIKSIKHNIDALALLHSLSKSHGLQTEKYTITQGKDGSDRIQCGNRNLNVTDFLTKEMHLSWKETKQYLEDRYLEQHGINPRKAIADNAEPSLIRAAWRSQLQHERDTRRGYMMQYRLEKSSIYSDTSLTRQERNVALSIAQMNKVIHDLHFKQQSREEREYLKSPPTASNHKENLMREESGVVVSHGEARYQHNKDNAQSYYVTLELNGTTREVWGKGLQETIKENGIQKGDKVTFTKEGQKEVTVTAKVEQEDGTLKREPIETHRNEWSVSKITEQELKKAASEAKAKEAQQVKPASKVESAPVQKKPLKTKTIKTPQRAVKAPAKMTSAFLDQHLEASRIIIHYPNLKQLGISAESITKTEKGDKIQYGDRQLSVTQLVKETQQIKPKELTEQLTNIYNTQVRDHERVIEYKNNFMNNERKTIAEMEKEESITKNKPQIETPQQTVQPIITSSEEQEKERRPLAPKEFKDELGEPMTHGTDSKGYVTYYQGKDKIITDRGKDVLIEQQSDKAVEIGLRLAIEKYGKHLDIQGTSKYKDQLIDVAVKNKLDISFKDKALNEKLIERKQQFEKGENIITKAEQSHQSKSQQPEKGQQQEQSTQKGWDR